MRPCWLGWFAVLSLLAPTLQCAEKLSVRVNNQSISFYPTSDLESAKKEAASAHKPIAWIASATKLLDGRGSITQTNSRGATLHARPAPAGIR